MKNIDLFNDFAAAILAKLYEGFPVKAQLDARHFCGHGEIDDFGGVIDDFGRPSRAFDIALSTIEWLKDSGYIRSGVRNAYGWSDVVLTDRGLSLLRATPGVLKGKESLGDKLIRLVREGSKEMARESIKELISAGIENAL